MGGYWEVDTPRPLRSVTELIRLSRTLGQLFMMGFEGTEITLPIRDLIENHHLGTILLTAKNLKCRSP